MNTSLAEITQGTPSSSENVVTLDEPGLDSPAPKQNFSSMAVSLSSRVSSKVKAKTGPTNILILELPSRFLPIIKSILCLSPLRMVRPPART